MDAAFLIIILSIYLSIYLICVADRDNRHGVQSSFPDVCLCATLVATETRAMSQKEVREEVGLEETNGKASAKAKPRAGVLLGSDDDRRY